MFYLIIGCVLASAAGLGVGAASLIYARYARLSLEAQLFATSSATRDMFRTWSMHQDERLSAAEQRLKACETGLQQTSQAHLSAELEGLAGDVAALASSQRKQFGKVWAELHHDGVLKRNADAQVDIETPEQVRARLRAQHGLPTLGRVNGDAGGE